MCGVNHVCMLGMCGVNHVCMLGMCGVNHVGMLGCVVLTMCACWGCVVLTRCAGNSRSMAGHPGMESDHDTNGGQRVGETVGLPPR